MGIAKRGWWMAGGAVALLGIRNRSRLSEWIAQHREVGAQKAFRHGLEAAVRRVPQGEWSVLSSPGASSVMERTYQATTNKGASVRLVFRDETDPEHGGRSYALFVDVKESGSFSNNRMLSSGGDQWLQGLAQGIDDYLASERERAQRESATSGEREHAARERDEVQSKL